MAIVVEHKGIQTDEIKDVAGSIILQASGNDVILNAPDSSGDIIFQTGTNERMRYDPATDAFQVVGQGTGFQRTNLSKLITSHTTNSGTGTETITGARVVSAFILGVSWRITTVIAGAGLTTFGIGDGSVIDRYGALIVTTDSSTGDMSDATADTFEFLTAAGDIVLTADAGQFDSGVIVVTTHYINLSAASAP